MIAFSIFPKIDKHKIMVCYYNNSYFRLLLPMKNISLNENIFPGTGYFVKNK
jgi:hypothetical protein